MHIDPAQKYLVAVMRTVALLLRMKQPDNQTCDCAFSLKREADRWPLYGFVEKPIC